MKLWGICSQCDRFPGKKEHQEGCPVRRWNDGKYHLSDFQAIAKCPEYAGELLVDNKFPLPPAANPWGLASK